MPLTPGFRLGPYEIVALIGAGGMGEVYRARDTRLDRTVAVKVLLSQLADNPELRQRFEREARAVSSLNHPHICALYDVGSQDGIDYLVMEYLEGETLAARLARGALEPPQVLEFAVQAADALDLAHRQGVFHRDLKPGNIMLTRAGVKLLDFGLAKFRAPAARAVQTAISTVADHPTELTAKGSVLGTFHYMAPEQLEAKETDGRTDVFAFGVVLYEMSTGRKPFEGRSQASIIAAILERDPPPITSLQPLAPPALERLVHKCLAKDPDDRWQTARDLFSELKWIAQEKAPGPAVPVTPATAASPPPARRRPLVWIAAIAALGVALLALAVVHLRETPPATVRFSVPAPEKGSFRTGSPNISPDGLRLTYAASTADGRQVLWVRPIDSLEARPLPGTDDAFAPFWSPDSRFIAFSASGNLKKVEASGGPPQTLCDAPQFTSGTWSGDGVIVFGSLRSALFRVAAAGGPATPLTTLDTARQETAHFLPYFLPDGRHFAYFTRSSRPEHTGNYLGALDAKPDSKERRRLLGASSNAIFRQPWRGAPGLLLFQRETTLMAQAFDTGKLALSGDPFPVAEAVGSAFDYGFFSVSANGVLAYRGGGGQDRHLIWFDREGKQLGIAGEPGAYGEVALSPQATHAAVSRTDPQTSNTDIWLLDLPRNIPSRFTFHPAPDTMPVWSPDGRRIAFSSARDGANNLYQKVSTGAGSEEAVLQSGIPKNAHDWSRDGRFLLYAGLDPKTKYDLWVLPLFGDRKPVPYLQTEFDETQGQFSPDGRWIAYTSNESGRYQIYVQAFPASGGKWQISSAGGTQARWRADGKELFFISTDAKLMSADVRTAPQFETAVPKMLFQTRIYGSTPVVHRWAPAPDGRRFLINSLLEQAASAPITVVLNWQPAGR